ncbi:MAG: L-threonylcarbamoyladenylate synthase, partial [Candidatus Woesebacteria bacterium]|jgi:L-threonylcarbamoyladenylate synthase
VYPTDTAYGLGGNALDEGVVRKIYELKKRSPAKPTHTVVRDWHMTEKLCKTNDHAKTLYDKFLPGALTIILLKRGLVPDTLTGSMPTLGIRIPDNPFTKALSRMVDFPYTTPSANESGGKTPYSVHEVKRQIDVSKVDLIVDLGKIKKGAPSTVIDISSPVVKILREGPISKQQLERVLNVKIL